MIFSHVAPKLLIWKDGNVGGLPWRMREFVRGPNVEELVEFEPRILVERHRMNFSLRVDLPLRLLKRTRLIEIFRPSTKTDGRKISILEILEMVGCSR